MKTRKLLSAILTICVVSVSFIAALSVSAQNTEGASNQNVQTAESSTKEFEIKNEKDFSKFMTTSEYWGANYKIVLTCDIDMQNEAFDHIENFSGHFDGGGHTVSNLSFKSFIKNNNGTISGIKFKNGNLIGYSETEGGFVEINEEDGVIDNCVIDMKSAYLDIKASFACTNKGKITNSEITMIVKNRYDNAGVFVNENHGTIEKCIAKGEVYGEKNVGGFAGQNWGKITNCNAEVNVYGEKNVGGFVGQNLGKITNCNADCNAEKIGDNSFCIGGFVGCNINDGIIENCTSTGNVDGNDTIGGFAGENDEGTITNCNAKGNVNGNYYVGGFAAQNWGIITNSNADFNAAEIGYNSFCIGGFVGVNGTGQSFKVTCRGIIINCNAKGNVTGNWNVGGFAGANSKGTIICCNAEGNVNGNRHVGGFVGFNSDGTITNSNAKGDINGNQDVGGFVGYYVVYHVGQDNKEDSWYADISRGIIKCIAEGKVNGEKIDLDKFVGKNEEGKIEDCEIV